MPHDVIQEFSKQKGTHDAFLVLAKFLNLSEMETTLYLGNPVVHFDTWALVMAYRRNRAVAIEMDKMVRELEELHGRWLPKIEYLFVQEGPRRDHIGKPLTQVTNRAWRNAVARAGLPKGTRFHDLRHTFASLHKRAGSDPYMIQRLGGWKSNRSMDRYTHILGPDLKRAAHNLDGVL